MDFTGEPSPLQEAQLVLPCHDYRLSFCHPEADLSPRRYACLVEPLLWRYCAMKELLLNTTLIFS